WPAMYRPLDPMRSAICAENISKTPGATMNSPAASTTFRRAPAISVDSRAGALHRVAPPLQFSRQHRVQLGGRGGDDFQADAGELLPDRRRIQRGRGLLCSPQP